MTFGSLVCLHDRVFTDSIASGFGLDVIQPTVFVAANAMTIAETVLWTLGTGVTVPRSECLIRGG